MLHSPGVFLALPLEDDDAHVDDKGEVEEAERPELDAQHLGHAPHGEERVQEEHDARDDHLERVAAHAFARSLNVRRNRLAYARQFR